MQRFHFQLFTISLLMFASCGNDNNNTAVLQGNEQEQAAIFGKNDHRQATPAPAVSEITATWGAYNDFADDIPKVNRNTVEGLKVVSDRLVVSVDSMSRFIPDTLNTRSIASRLIVVQARIKLLQQQLGFDRLDGVKVEEHISEINNAHTNFITQMNEKFIKDGINQEQKDVEDREIEKRIQDSIFKAELRDNSGN